MSEFRCYALIINKYKPCDAVEEVAIQIATYLAEELIRVAGHIPHHIVEVLGDAKIEEIRQQEADADKLDMEDQMLIQELGNTLERQLTAPDLAEQRLRLGDFVAACGDLRELAVCALNFPDDLFN
jgi:hypothetical protein